MSRNALQSKAAYAGRYKHSAPISIKKVRTRAGAAITAGALLVMGATTGIAAAAVRYEVTAGDSLATIAEEHGYKGESAWRRLYSANPSLEDPDLIVPGQKLRIPDRDEHVKPRALPKVTVAPRLETTTSASRSAPVEAPPAAPSTSVWTELAACESGGNWAANTGNGYYGGLQFSLETWQGLGGSGYPHEASAATQIAMAQRLQAQQGWGAWPGCAAELGLL